MSEKKEEISEKREPVNVDELEVKVFIIAKNPSAMDNSAKFLTRRGWPTTCIGNISKAIGTIVQESPDITLISVDHPNPNVMKLPILLTQTLNTVCVGFTEESSAMSTSRLNNSRFGHKFSGFPSGPSLHRYIRQVLNEIYNPEEIATSSSAKKKKSGKGADSGRIEIKGSSGSDVTKISSSGKAGSGVHKVKGSSGKKQSLKDYAKAKGMSADGDKPMTQMSAAELLDRLSAEDESGSAKGTFGYMPDQEGSLNSGNMGQSRQSLKDAIGKNQSVSKGEGEKSAGDIDSELAEKKKRAAKKKKSFPWQKTMDTEEKPIKEQDNRPGANFEMNQSRTQDAGKEDDYSLDTSTKNKDQGTINQESIGKKGNQGLLQQDGIKKKTGDYVPELEAKEKGNFEFGEEKGGKKGSTEGGKATDSEKKSLSEALAERDEKKKQREESSEDDPLSTKDENENGEVSNSDNKQQDESGTAALGTKENIGKVAQQDGKDNTNSEDFDSDEVGTGKNKRSKVSKNITPNSKKLTEEEDKFKRAVNKALIDSCNDPDPEVVIHIEEPEQLGVIPVESKKFHGYLVLGRGGIGFSMGTSFLESLSESIEKHLALAGIDVHCQKPFVIETDKFDFNKWAHSVENFTIFEQSEREEIALTFVPTEYEIPSMGDSSVDENMTYVNVRHISPKRATNFNSYIHLEKNEKYYLYVKEGNKLLQRQKEKLKKNKKRENLHIKKDDFHLFKKYVAENLINDIIEKVVSKKDESDDEAA